MTVAAMLTAGAMLAPTNNAAEEMAAKAANALVWIL